MASLIYKRVSTGQQSTARQNLVLAEARIADLITFEEQIGAPSRSDASAGHPRPARPRLITRPSTDQPGTRTATARWKA